MKTLFAMVALWCAACGPENVIRLSVVGDSSITDDLRGRITALDITVSGVQNRTKSYPINGLPSEERIELLPSATSGQLKIDVDATDGRQAVLASGSSTTNITGDRVVVLVTLSLKSPDALGIDPPTAKVTRSHPLPFTATRPVTWSVVEPGGGTIDANGMYTAPDGPGGPYTIRAASTQDDAVATAQVTVVDYGLEVVAGIVGGSGWADGAGSDARMTSIDDAVWDSVAHLTYVVDGAALRKIDMVANPPTIQTVFGSPYFHSRDDGPFATAHLASRVSGMALDPTRQHIYLCDSHRIRVADLTANTVSTFNVYCDSLAMDPGDNGANPATLYFTYVAGINKVTLSDLTAGLGFSVVAGQTQLFGLVDGPNHTTARFGSSLSGLAVDLNGGFPRTLYVCDTNEHAIRKVVDSATGSVTTVAGTGIAGYADGVATQAQFRNPTSLLMQFTSVLVVSDHGNKLLRNIDLGTSLVSTRSGTYIPPSADGRVVPSNSVDGAAGMLGTLGADSFAYTAPVFIGELSRVYVADGPIIRLSAPSLQTVTLGSTPHLGAVDGVGAAMRAFHPVDITGNGSTYYFAESGNSVVRKLSLQTGEVTTLAGKAGYYDHVDGMGDAARFRAITSLSLVGNTLFVGDSYTLRAIDVTTRVVSTAAGVDGVPGTTDGKGAGALFGFFTDLDSDGKTLIIGDDCRVRQYDLSTQMVSTVAGPSTCPPLGTRVSMDGTGASASFGRMAGLAHVADQWFVADFPTIRQVNLTSGEVTTVAGYAGPRESLDGIGTNAHLTGLGAMAGSPSGLVYFMDESTLRSFNVQTGEVKTVLGKLLEGKIVVGGLSAARLNAPSGMTVTSSGDVLMVDFFENAVTLARLP